MQHKPLIHSHDTPSSTPSFISVLLGLPKLLGSPRGIPDMGTENGMRDLLSA